MRPEPCIERIDVFDFANTIRTGDDTCFIAVRAVGLTGWYGPIPASVAACIQTRLQQAAVGRSVHEPRALREALQQRATDVIVSRGVRSWAIGAIDCAVWDLRGRLAGTSVAHLLSAESVGTVAAYASWLRLNITDGDAIYQIGRAASDGWSFTKWGLRAGNFKCAMDLVNAAKLAAAAAGGQAAFDALLTWDIDLMRAFARSIDPTVIIWLEDPLAEAASYPHVASLCLPLAVGEHLLVYDDPIRLLMEVKPVAFTFDVAACGGLTRAIDLLNLARQAGISAFPHGRSLNPAIHLAAAYPDVIPAVEYRLQWEPRRQQIYADPLIPARGQIRLPATAGLSVTPAGR